MKTRVITLAITAVLGVAASYLVNNTLLAFMVIAYIPYWMYYVATPKNISTTYIMFTGTTQQYHMASALSVAILLVMYTIIVCVLYYIATGLWALSSDGLAIDTIITLLLVQVPTRYYLSSVIGNISRKENYEPLRKGL